MKKIIVFFPAIFLTACLSSSGGATSTPQVTVTLLPTNTPKPTSTPQPENGLTQEILASAQEYFGDAFEVPPDGKVKDIATGTEIPGFAIVPFDEKAMINRGRPTDPVPTWAVQRVYQFEDKADFTVNMTQYDMTVDNGKIDMFGWVYENGEFSRQKVEFAASNNGVVKLDGYSPEEVQYQVLTNSSLEPKHRDDSEVGRISLPIYMLGRVSEKIDGVSKFVFKYNGMREITERIVPWGANYIPVFENGNWVNKETSVYVVVSFGDRKRGLICWYGKGGNEQVRAIDGIAIDFYKFFAPGTSKIQLQK